MNKKIELALSEFEKIREEVQEPRHECDHPGYESAQEHLLELLKHLSIEEMKENISEMTEEQLNDLWWNVEYLLESTPNLLEFLDKLSIERKNDGIRYEIIPYLND